MIAVLACIAGFGLARLLLPAAFRLSLHNLLLLALGAGFGIAIASSLYFLCLAFAGPNFPLLIAVEGVVLLGLLIAGLLAKPRLASLTWGNGPATPWYLTALFLVAAAAAVTMFLFYSLTKPHGEWDAWSIWNLRARFLYLGGQFWTDGFSNEIAWSNPGYPLLIPGIVALSWTIAHAQSTSAPIVVAFVFTIATVAILVATLGILRSKTQALIAGILLLGTVSFIEIGATQYADVPLSFYILAAAALLCMQDREPENARFTLLAGLAAGFAAWTKNEGLLFVAALIIARAVTRPRELVRLAAGMLPPLCVVAFFKIRYAPASPFLSANVAARATDIARWITSLEGFVKLTFAFGSFLLPIALVLLLYWYLVRFKVSAGDRASITTLLITIGIMLAGDFAAYILLPSDVAALMNTTLERSFLQLWPIGLLAFFLACNVPQLAKPLEASKPGKRRR